MVVTPCVHPWRLEVVVPQGHVQGLVTRMMPPDEVSADLTKQEHVNELAPERDHEGKFGGYSCCQLYSPPSFPIFCWW